MGVYPVNAVVNAVIWFPVELQAPKGSDPRDAVATHALELRKGMGKLKDPEEVRRMAADVAKIQSEVAWNKYGQDMVNVNESCLVMNVATR